MDGIFGTLFDLDGNGILSPEEHALEFVMLDGIMRNEEDPADDGLFSDDPGGFDPFAGDTPETEW